MLAEKVKKAFQFCMIQDLMFFLKIFFSKRQGEIGRKLRFYRKW